MGVQDTLRFGGCWFFFNFERKKTFEGPVDCSCSLQRTYLRCTSDCFTSQNPFEESASNLFPEVMGFAILEDTNLFLNVLASNPMLLNKFYLVTDTLGMENRDLGPLSVGLIRNSKGFSRKCSVLKCFSRSSSFFLDVGVIEGM